MVTVVVMWVWLGIAILAILGWAAFGVWERQRWSAAMVASRWEPDSDVDPESGELVVFLVRRAYLRKRVVDINYEELTTLAEWVSKESAEMALAWAVREADRRNNQLDHLADAASG